MRNLLLVSLLLYPVTSLSEWVENKHGTFYDLPVTEEDGYLVLIEREYKNKSSGDYNGYNKEIIRKIDCKNRKEALVVAKRYENGIVDKVFDYEAKLGLSRLLRVLDPISLRELQDIGICPK